MFLNRHIRENFEKALLRSPVVLLTGPRQSGKSILVKEIAREKNYSYITLDNIENLALAKNNPLGFIANLKKPVIIDEIQRVPELFLVIKQTVDENRIPGNFILTGSANPLAIPTISDSLAGRMEIFYLHPLSQGELAQKKETFLDALFSGNIRDLKPQVFTASDLHNRMTTGGFPPLLTLDEEGQAAWFASYITTLLERDVKDLLQITDLTDLPKLLYLLAARASGLVNNADLSRESGLVPSTFKRYLTLLQTIYMVTFNLPWFSNIGLRFVKAPKIYFEDTGLLTYLLRINSSRLAVDSLIGGKIFENFVVSEIKKQMSWNSNRLSMYHFRDHVGKEIDLILENPLGELVAIEVKNTQTIRPNDFSSMQMLQEKMDKKFLYGLVIYAGNNYAGTQNEIMPVGKNLFTVPVSALWA